MLPAAGFAEVDGHHDQPRGPGQRARTRRSRRRAPPGPTGSSPPSWPAGSAPTSGSSRVDDIRAEIAAVAPAYAGLTPTLLDVAGRPTASWCRCPTPAPRAGRRGPARRPMPASERRRPTRRGRRRTTAEADDRADAAEPAAPGAARLRAGPAAEPPPLDRYSLRLVATRKLYDQGTLVPAVARRWPGWRRARRCAVNPYDFDRLGVADGDRGAGARRPRADAARPRSRPTPACPGARPSVAFNQPGARRGRRSIDATAPVTDVRVETAAS